MLTRAYDNAKENFVKRLVDKTVVYPFQLRSAARAAARAEKELKLHGGTGTAGTASGTTAAAAAGSTGGAAAGGIASAVDNTASLSTSAESGSMNTDSAAAAGTTVVHPPLLESLSFEPSADLMDRLRRAGRKRSRTLVQEAVQKWAESAFNAAFQPRETVRSFGWRLIKPRRVDLVKVCFSCFYFFSLLLYCILFTSCKYVCRYVLYCLDCDKLDVHRELTTVLFTLFRV